MSESGPEYARRYEYNALNQLVRREESRAGHSPTVLAYEYDLRGNRVREKSVQDGRVMKEFAYDGANRMVRGETEKGSSFYRYDGLGRRVGREQEKNSVQYVVDFVSGRNDDLAAYTQGFFAQSYSYANGQRIQQVTKAWEDTSGANAPEGILPSLPEELYIHEDIMGSTRRWSTASGDTFAQVEYDVWGLPLQQGAEGQDYLNADTLNPRYTNHTYDDVLGMYHAQYRFLDATNRSFTTVDPLKDGPNWYSYCEGNPTSYLDLLGLEKIVVSGGLGGDETFKYSFIETALLQIETWQERSDEKITWVIADWQYSDSNPMNIQNFITVAQREYNVEVLTITSKDDLFAYLDKADRANDLITEMAFFAHGLPRNGIYELSLGYGGYFDSGEIDLNITISDLHENLKASSFARGNFTLFASCRTGNEYQGGIFAQEWVNITRGYARAVRGVDGRTDVGRTDYANIYPDERNEFDQKLGAVQDWVKKTLGWSDFHLVPLAEREVAREQYGFSVNGSKNFPVPSKDAEWAVFFPNK